MLNTYIISVSEVKAIVPSINTNISDTLINEAILMVQNTLLKNSLGQEFCEEILLQVSGGTISTANQYLIDNFINRIISFAVWQYIIITLSLQTSEAGLRIKVSDHSTPAESSDIAFMRNYIQNFIDGAREEMYRYISYHPTSYPLYYNDKYGDDPIKHRFNFRISKVQKDYYDDRPLGSDTGPVGI